MPGSAFSAAEQGLGYTFQYRFALLKALELPEDCSVHVERYDDVEFTSQDGTESLASLKHKAPGDRLTDLSIDFWKSVRIWLARYVSTGRIGSNARFILFTTADVSPASFLNMFVGAGEDDEARARAAERASSQSASADIAKVRTVLESLTEKERCDFYGRITIFPATPRIQDIPALIDRGLRAVDKKARPAVFERLEGWWTDLVIKRLAEGAGNAIRVQEVSDKLASIADEYKADNLPITFRGQAPSAVDALNDPRIFVEQLRALKLSERRVHYAIIDYYRAFQQRSSWAREDLVVSGEMEEYECRLVEEWDRFREIYCERITDNSDEDSCCDAGRQLYLWAETQTSHLRIRERVTEPYVVRGTFHILANDRPDPRVHWHPRFLARLAGLLGVAA